MNEQSATEVQEQQEQEQYMSNIALGESLIGDINKYVEEGENEFYLELCGKDENGFLYRLRDGFAQSTLAIVKQSELPLYARAVKATRLNPLDAMDVFKSQLKHPLKRRVLQFLARAFGKAMFASLRLDGLKTMVITDPSVGECLMEFPRQAW